MSVLYDEGQLAIADASLRVLDARMSMDRLLSCLEHTGRFDEVFWRTAVEQGWTALTIPEEHDGLGLGLLELGLVAQAAGTHTSGAPFLTTGFGAGRALVNAGCSELNALWLPRLMSGEAVMTVALVQGGTPLPEDCNVVLEDDRITGVCRMVTGGLQADAAVVWTRHGEQPALALVELNHAERKAANSHDNSRLYADITFAAAPARLLASGQDARRIGLDMLAAMGVVTAHEQLGGAEALLHRTRDYALTRKAFGQPIGAFQSIKHRIAELYALIEIARANCIHASSRDSAPDFVIAAADARITATQAYDTAARDCIQIHGGIGATWEQGLHLHLRRARSLAVEQGNLMFWEDVVVDRLVKAAS